MNNNFKCGLIQEHKGNTFNKVILAMISKGCREASKREGKDIDRHLRKEKQKEKQKGKYEYGKTAAGRDKRMKEKER
jgi:hypothetical protein